MLHVPEVRKKYLRKETQAIKLEEMSESIENCNRHINAYPINDELVSLESMTMCIQKARVFEQTPKEVGSKTQGICYY